ncbi:hypothetical protein SRABI84_05211 [Peribacillus simplex]|uniref:hypothetical protein n=1 Tax=Peribacillus simplex TaxID=1478 RepID=UPI001DC38F98|nr:hypothetical protein [Peribacillus simplex]CAH0319797.1 hypothetical protein SRABI84_05211 [Peribacillus simplex]
MVLPCLKEQTNGKHVNIGIHRLTDRQKQAIKYMSLVFNDLDIDVNDLKGKDLTGYTYNSGGKKVEELEKFISQK